MEKDYLVGYHDLSAAELRRYKRDPTACAHVGSSRKWRSVQPGDVIFERRPSRRILFPDLCSCYAATVSTAHGTVAAHFRSTVHGSARRGWFEKEAAALDADARRVVRAVHAHLGAHPGALRLHLFTHPDAPLQAMARHLEAYLRQHAGLHVAAAPLHTYPRVDLYDPDDRTRTNILVAPGAREGHQVEMKPAWWAESDWRTHRGHAAQPESPRSGSASSASGSSRSHHSSRSGSHRSSQSGSEATSPQEQN